MAASNCADRWKLASRDGKLRDDANGNTATEENSSGTTTSAWDSENRLSSVTLPGSGSIVSFQYDPFGRRIEKIWPTTTSIFAYDCDNLVETANSSSGVVARYSQGLNIDDRGSLPETITVDNGSEFSGRAMEARGMANDM